MKSLFYYIFYILLCTLIAGIFGIVHDQVTYTISNEYFVYFKFIQFKIPDVIVANERLGVAVVGWMATWWAGAIFGFIIGFLGIKNLNYRKIFKIKLKAMLLMIISTSIGAFIGYLIGVYIKQFFRDFPLTIGISDQYSELNVAFQNKAVMQNFLTVGMIHNLSYIGSIVGLIIAMIYHYRKSKMILE